MRIKHIDYNISDEGTLQERYFFTHLMCSYTLGSFLSLVICSKIMDCGNICQNHYNKCIPRKHKFITPLAPRYCFYLDEKGNYIRAAMNFDIILDW